MMPMRSVHKTAQDGEQTSRQSAAIQGLKNRRSEKKACLIIVLLLCSRHRGGNEPRSQLWPTGVRHKQHEWDLNKADRTKRLSDILLIKTQEFFFPLFSLLLVFFKRLHFITDLVKGGLKGFKRKEEEIKDEAAKAKIQFGLYLGLDHSLVCNLDKKRKRAKWRYLIFV